MEHHHLQKELQATGEASTWGEEKGEASKKQSKDLKEVRSSEEVVVVVGGVDPSQVPVFFMGHMFY